MSFDPEQAARQLIASHKMVDSDVILPFMLYRQKAELDDENFLASHGYLWAQKNGWYLNEEENSAVVYLHNRRFIWVYGSLAKIFQNPDKFYAWLDNDAKNFTSQIIKLSKAANAHMNESITQSNLHTLIRGIIRTILKEVADSSYYGQDAMAARS